MDYLRCRKVNTVLLDARKIVRRQLIPDRPVRRDQWLDARRVEHIKPNHHVTAVSLFQDVRVSVQQLRDYPLLKELDAILITVRLAEHRRECRDLDLVPNVVAAALDEAHPALCDI